MRNEKGLRFHRIYSLLLSVIIGITGICFMIACGCIYYTGNEREQVYTGEIVAKAFGYIAIPVYLCLAMLIISFVMEFFAPLQFKKGKLDRPYRYILERLYLAKDPDACDPETQRSLISLQTKRTRFLIIRSILITLCSIAFLIYALDGSHFHRSEINSSMIKAMCFLSICMVVPFVFSIITSYQCRKTMILEIELLKKLPTSNHVAESSTEKKDYTLQIVQFILLALGIGCALYGLCSNGTADVLTKAINICTECIGLG